MAGEKPSLDQCLAWRKREHSHSGEAGILQQQAEGEAEVRKKSLHGLLVGGMALNLLPKG